MLLRSLMQEKFKAEPMKMRTVTPSDPRRYVTGVHTRRHAHRREASWEDFFNKKGQHCGHNNGHQLLHLDDDQIRWTKTETNNNNERRLTATDTSSEDRGSAASFKLQIQNVDQVVQKSQPRELPRQVSQNKTDTETYSLTFFALLFAYLSPVVASPYSSFTHTWIL